MEQKLRRTNIFLIPAAIAFGSLGLVLGLFLLACTRLLLSRSFFVSLGLLFGS